MALVSSHWEKGRKARMRLYGKKELKLALLDAGRSRSRLGGGCAKKGIDGQLRKVASFAAILTFSLPIQTTYAWDWPWASSSSAGQQANQNSDTVSYPDSEWKEFHSAVVERFHKMRGLLGRNQKCEVAIFSSLPITFTLANGKAPALEQFLPKTVDCIGDISVSQNTIYEKSGCALVTFDTSTDSYSRFFNNFIPTPMATKTCRNGGFEELMQLKGQWTPYAAHQIVEQSLFTKNWNDDRVSALIYVADAKYVKWFLEARARGNVFFNSQKEKGE